ncbi:MAG: DUF5009 domain-containing protein, partial [Gemmatimonadaceae bacterium]
GLLINAFPFFTWGSIAGNATPSLWDRIADRPHHLRYTGVLQRIGLAYVAGALLTMRGSLTRLVAIVVSLLFGYWFAVTLLPVPDSGILGALTLNTHDRNLGAWLDRLIIGESHTWVGSVTWDPEGLLSTIPAIATVILGVFAGRWIASPRPLADRIAGLCAIGALAMVAALMWHWSFPINKNLWTSSYVLFTAGMACVALGACLWVIDVQRVRWWTSPWVVFGVNPIVAFAGSGVLARLIYSIIFVTAPGGKRIPLEQAMYQTLFASWLDPRNASLAFALLTVAVWYAILLVLYKKKIILKV